MHFESPHLLFLSLLLGFMALILFARKAQARHTFSPEALALLMRSKRTLPQWVRHTLMLLAAALFIVALARPAIDRGEIEVTSSTIDIIVGFDISRSMFANDIYPSRLELAKRKFDAFLNDADNMRIGVIGFSSRAFMVSPLTEDFATLRYLVSNMNTDTVSLKGTDILQALEQTDALLKNSDKKALLLLTDGGDSKDFSKEIAYAKAHNIVVFVYNIGTEKGGVIRTDSGAMTDQNGNIVVVRRNEAIKTLAIDSGGAYMNHSLSRNDIGALANAVASRFTARKERSDTIRDTEELFIWPLGAGTTLLLLSLYAAPPRRRRRHA